MQKHQNPHERQVVALVMAGATNKKIARDWGFSPKTVTNVLTRIFAKTSAHSRGQFAASDASRVFIAHLIG